MLVAYRNVLRKLKIVIRLWTGLWNGRWQIWATLCGSWRSVGVRVQEVNYYRRRRQEQQLSQPSNSIRFPPRRGLPPSPQLRQVLTLTQTAPFASRRTPMGT